jgi:hypothetical protein
MSDTVAAALIAGGVAAVSNVITLLVARRSAGTTERVANGQAAVTIEAERTRHGSEMARLERGHLEADRQVRRDAYARLLVTIEKFDTLTSDYTPPPTHAALADWLQDFRAAQVQVQLVESAAVTDARRAFAAAFNELTAIVEANLAAGQAMEDALGYPYVEMRPRFAAAGQALSNAMRNDLAYAVAA